MTINISRFVRITSGVGGASGVPSRELIGRLFTTNVLVPAGAVVEFDSLSAVVGYFGPGEEANRAAFYFGFISKSLGSPKALSFSRIALTAEPARVFGMEADSLASLKLITAGALTVNVGADVASLTGLSFATANTYADVATVLQTALRAVENAPQFATASVTYNAVSGGFNFMASVPGNATVSVSGVSADALGWGSQAILSPGAAAQTPMEALSASYDASSNFGSFAFVPSLTDAQLVEVAEWTAALNVELIACVRVTDASLATLPAAVENLAGVALTYAPNPAEYDEMVPMIVFASTNYDQTGSAQTYMFQQANLSAKVTTDSRASELDALRVNYYGRTQSGGQALTFYMRGVLCGTLTAPLDMNTFANEIWFKDAARSALMGLLLAAPRVPANADGRAQVLAVVQEPITRALRNGTVSVGKTLTAAQKAYVTTVTADPDAWRQIEGTGYWVDAVVVSVAGTPPEYRVDYRLVYSKDDAIRLIVGQHDLV